MLDKDEVRPVCLKYFLTNSAFYGALKVAIPVAIVFIGSVIGYALANNSTVSVLKTTSEYHSQQIETLNKEINYKLDLLIKKADETERQRRLDAIRNGAIKE